MKNPLISLFAFLCAATLTTHAQSGTTGGLPVEMAENELIRKAAKLCEEGAFTPEELALYEGYWDWVRVEKTIREGSLAKGEEIGLAKVVINSKKSGLPVETISSITGLTIQEINKILIDQ